MVYFKEDGYRSRACPCMEQVGWFLAAFAAEAAGFLSIKVAASAAPAARNPDPNS